MADRRGLTFVELLIAVTMVAILFTGLAVHLRGGMAVWERVTRSTDMRQRERASLNRLQRDLANAFVFDDRPQSYVPGDTSLSPAVFSSDSVAFYAAPAREALFQTPVQFLTYWCGARGDQSGLWRQRWTVNESRAKRGAEPELILPECGRLQFSYAYLRSNEAALAAQPLDWQSSWQESPASLPRLIQLEIELKEKIRNRGEEATTTRSLKRLLLVPAGVLRAPQQAQP